MKHEAQNCPIGVFDSGVGGLTLVSALAQVLPEERVLYFGDTARCPYGPRPSQEVKQFSLEIADHFVRRGAKMIVVACNTATAAALPYMREKYDVPIIGVIEPGARAAARITETGYIGVIGTEGTVASGAYERALHHCNAEVRVTSLACPAFVPLVESGRVDGDEVDAVVGASLAPLRDVGIDTLILGCTHYPLLARAIARSLGPSVKLISSAGETAWEVKQSLDRTQMRRRAAGLARLSDHYRFETSANAERMVVALQTWLGLCAPVAEIHALQSANDRSAVTVDAGATVSQLDLGSALRLH